MADGVERIVRAVADREDARPEELPPLEDAIDTDCLERFFAEGTNGLLRFDYHGYSVTYHADGSVVVEPTEGTAFE